MKKDVFDRIVELEGTKLPLNADELLMLILDATTRLEATSEITTKEQKTIMGIVACAIDFALEEPEEAKKVIKITKLSVQHTQKIAKAVEGKDAKEAVLAMLEALANGLKQG